MRRHFKRPEQPTHVHTKDELTPNQIMDLCGPFPVSHVDPFATGKPQRRHRRNRNQREELLDLRDARGY